MPATASAPAANKTTTDKSAASLGDLRRERASCHDRMCALEAMINQEVNERPGKLTDDQISSEYDQLEKQLDSIDAKIETAEVWDRRRAVSTERTKRLNSSAGVSVPTQPAGDIRETADRIEVKGHASENDPAGGFSSPREYMTAVMKAGRISENRYDSARMDERLAPLWVAAGSDEQSGASQQHGGYLVPVAFSPDTLMLRPDDDPIAGRTRPVPMESPMVQINYRVDKNHSTSVSGGLVVTRRPETVAGDASRMSFKQLDFRAHSLFGIAFATEEILTDSPSTFAALIADSFQDEMSAAVLRERLTGTGKGEYLGVLKSACKIAVDRETNNEVSYTDVLSMMSRCWRFQNAVWVCNHSVIPQLGLLRFPGGDTTSWPLFVMDARDGFSGILFGRPILFTEYCKALGTEGDLMLVNWSE